jgi:hypothetical protein
LPVSPFNIPHGSTEVLCGTPVIRTHNCHQSFPRLFQRRETECKVLAMLPAKVRAGVAIIAVFRKPLPRIEARSLARMMIDHGLANLDQRTALGQPQAKILVFEIEKELLVEPAHFGERRLPAQECRATEEQDLAIAWRRLVPACPGMLPLALLCTTRIAALGKLVSGPECNRFGAAGRSGQQ